MPKWVDDCKFSVASGCDTATRIANGHASDVDFMKAALKDPSLRNVLLSPSTIKRPDFEGVMGTLQTTPWMLSISSKLYSRRFDDTNNNDLRSTDLSKCYYKADGSGVNPNARHLQREWEKLLKSQKALFKRSLRVHFCLPDVSRGSNVNDRINVEKDGSIVLYITSANADRFLRPPTFGVLSEFSCFQASTVVKSVCTCGTGKTATGCKNCKCFKGNLGCADGCGCNQNGKQCGNAFTKSHD